MTNLVKPKRRRASLEARKARSGYVFVLPFLLGIVLIYLPILLDSIWFSFNSLVYDTQLGEWVLKYEGISFYKNALLVDEKFVPALLAGIQQLIFEVPAIIIFSLFIAVVLNQKMLGRAAFRAIFFVPVIIATGLMESINATDIMSDVTQGGVDDGSGPTDGSGGIISALDVEKL